MKISVLHDENGQIASLLTQPDGAPRATVDVAPGHRLTDVDVVELDAGLDPMDLAQRLARLRDYHRIDGTGRLVPRTASRPAD